MSQNEIMLFAGLAGFGVLVGTFTGIIGARRKAHMATAILLSGTIAAGLPLMWFFAGIVVENLNNGAGFFQVLLSATFITIVLALTVPFISGIPALISAAVSFSITNRYLPRNLDRHETPPGSAKSATTYLCWTAALQSILQ